MLPYPHCVQFSPVQAGSKYFNCFSIDAVVFVPHGKRPILKNFADIPVAVVFILHIVADDICPALCIAEVHRGWHVRGMVSHLAIVHIFACDLSVRTGNLLALIPAQHIRFRRDRDPFHRDMVEIARGTILISIRIRARPLHEGCELSVLIIAVAFGITSPCICRLLFERVVRIAFRSSR